MLDARLRPEGEKGPLSSTLETYQAYYGNRAQLWEIHALTRARFVTGPLGPSFIQMAHDHWRKASQRADLFEQINAMLERVRRERGSGSDFRDFKTGIGGIIEAEFLVQALQMREDVWEPNLEHAVDRLRDRGTLTDAETEELKEAYGFLRRCESVLRRYESKPVSVLPASHHDQQKLAIRSGYDDFDAFRDAYGNARDAIHGLYVRHVEAMKGD